MSHRGLRIYKYLPSRYAIYIIHYVYYKCIIHNVLVSEHKQLETYQKEYAGLAFSSNWNCMLIYVTGGE